MCDTPRDRGVQVVDHDVGVRVALAELDRLVERGGSGLVHAVDREVHELELDPGAQLRQRGDARAPGREVQGDHVGHGRGAGCGDEEAAARAPLHRRDLFVLEQPDRLAEDGTADSVAVHELRLGTEEVARLEAAGGDAEEDLAGDELRAACAPAGRDQRDAAGQRLACRPPAPEDLGLDLEMATHALARERAVVGDDRLGDADVRAVGARRGGGVQRARVPEVQRRHAVEDVDEELQRGVPGERRQQRVQRLAVGDRARLLGREQITKTLAALVVQPDGRELGHDLLEHHPCFEHLVEAGVDPVEVEDGGVDDRVDGRLDDDEPTARTAPACGPPAGARGDGRLPGTPRG